MEIKVQSIDRAFDILELLSKEQDGLTLTAIGSQLDLPRSTVFRLLATLRNRGYIEQDGSGSSYRLGLGFIELCSLYLNNLELKTEAAPYIKELSARTRCTVFLAIRQQTDAVYIEKAEQFNSIRKYSIIGKRKPLYCTSLGKSLILDQSDDETRELLSTVKFEKAGPNTHETMDELLADLAEARSRGWTFDNEEAEPGMQCVAAPVRDYRGDIIAAVSVVWLLADAPELDRNQIAELVQSTTAVISKRMGYLVDKVAKPGYRA
jgi:DNA-binding IclR family transcriptional regulator